MSSGVNSIGGRQIETAVGRPVTGPSDGADGADDGLVVEPGSYEGVGDGADDEAAPAVADAAPAEAAKREAGIRAERDAAAVLSKAVQGEAAVLSEAVRPSPDEEVATGQGPNREAQVTPYTMVSSFIEVLKEPITAKGLQNGIAGALKIIRGSDDNGDHKDADPKDADPIRAFVRTLRNTMANMAKAAYETLDPNIVNSLREAALAALKSVQGPLRAIDDLSQFLRKHGILGFGSVMEKPDMGARGRSVRHLSSSDIVFNPN